MHLHSSVRSCGVFHRTPMTSHPAAAVVVHRFKTSNNSFKTSDTAISMISSIRIEVAAQNGTACTNGVHCGPGALHVHPLQVVQLLVKPRDVLFQSNFALLKLRNLQQQSESTRCQTQNSARIMHVRVFVQRTMTIASFRHLVLFCKQFSLKRVTFC
jgi:hypothetical protein